MLITILTASGFYSRISEVLPHFGDAEVRIWPGRALHNPEALKSAAKALKDADIALVHATEEPFWEGLWQGTAKDVERPLIWLSMHNETELSRSNVGPKRAMEALTYMERGGANNALYLLRFLAGIVRGDLRDVPPPESLPPFGLWHPDAKGPCLKGIPELLALYEERGLRPWAWAGLVLHRHFWCVDKPEVEEAIIRAIESNGMGVIPAFISGEDSGASEESAEFLKGAFSGAAGPKARSIVKLTSIFQPNPGDRESPGKGLFVGDDSPAHGSVRLFRELNVPVFQPVISFRQSNSEWEKNPQGVLLELAWSVAMPEFEGAVEPLFVGGTERPQGEPAPGSLRKPHPERVGRLADRVASWARLAQKPPSERKVAIILHNAPCASVEATVGTASRLDPFESVKNILGSLKAKGYKVRVPESGEEVIRDIMDHKAIADFRWTNVQEIVGKGGAIKLLPNGEYREWFDRFPEDVRAHMTEAWGKPPGEEIDEVPAAMVLDGDIVITGRKWGDNALVMLQPKRGCAGPRCDGRVCVVLQDPLVPPPHQYMASYRWLQEPSGYGADVILHVGTHGNLEFLPGKAVGLSGSCHTDLAIHKAPNLYIYNADVTSDGIAAKRRSYATLVDHMQATFKEGGLYGELSELRELLGEWARAGRQLGRRNEVEGIIRERLGASRLLPDLKPLDPDFETLAKRLRRALNETAASLVEGGLHAFGKPIGEADLPFFAYSVIRFENPEAPSIRHWLAKARGHSFQELLRDSSELVGGTHLSGGEILEAIGSDGLRFTAMDLDGMGLGAILSELGLENAPGDCLGGLAACHARILGIQERAKATDELGSLGNALAAGYVTPGPSALIMRGREDVLPTGRNFYSRDPSLVPTPAAWRVGKTLAEATVARFLEEEGRYPKSVSFFWISSDLINADGEEYAEMLALIGAKPVWSRSGKVTGFEIIPPAELKRPRIDLTVRMSGIMRDNFPEAVALLDNAVKAVALLDEPDNYVRDHTLENLSLEGKGPGGGAPDPSLGFRRAASRIYSNAPGSCSSGVYYAVMASAWESERDLADIFIAHNAYIYGADDYGVASPTAFRETLKRVDVNTHKLSGDEQDFLNSGGYFSAVGGMALTVEGLKGSKAKNYLSDTREPGALSVRTLGEELCRSFRTRLLNPAWIEAMKAHGYKGAADISRRITNTFGWQATTKEVDGAVFDELTRTYFLDPANREFFEKANPWALEEIGRRLLEAESRGLWDAEPGLLEELKEKYLALEGVLEESTEAYGGELQGGSVDIVTVRDISKWKERMDSFLGD
ncbi:MAG: cobaltochelatase subunit CobN [Deltaproteobacteria bacterium]|jgi:cobaltochelatase CobN|nr:cobaltochelatase subunit CobN [Deltaproteobacteria bacterium]